METHFEGKIEFRFVMAGLVRDVSDFMTPEEREETNRDPESGINQYCLLRFFFANLPICPG